jgi:hypothetical protein
MNETENRESFIRWQTVTRDHFSSVSNLILGLATGLLAFLTTGFNPAISTCKCYFLIGTISMVLLAASISLAVWCAITRLRDFRATAQIARTREKGKEVSDDARQETRILGQRSWCLFWWQLVFFGFGSCGVTLTVIMKIWA